MNKKAIIGLVVWFLSMAMVLAGGVRDLPLIPQPQEVQMGKGVFLVRPDTFVFADPNSRGTAEFLAEPLRQATGYPIETRNMIWPKKRAVHGIFLTTKDADVSLGPDGYELSVSPDQIVIRASNQAGMFYGVQTLLQLLPPEIFSSNTVTSGIAWQVPAVHIIDWPRFQWRGLMLDVSRHFFNKTEVEKILAAMARYKLNRFHWHLTDDQGWRIQIQKYPRLTEIGAWRDGIGYGLASNSSTAYDPDGRYGGYYTSQDIHEVVAYATARHIMIVPEIEMPGHSMAALAAYPEYGCALQKYSVPVHGGVTEGVYSPANDGTFQFLDDVLAEVFQMFPGPYIHIGGDEVSPGPWTKDPACQALMQREGLKSPDELESWFIRRIEKFANAHGKTIIGWSEIARGGLAKNAVVMDWIGGGLEAASAGHKAVMTPTEFCYLDYYQSTNHDAEPRAIGGYLPLEKIYAFDPIPEKLPAQYDSYILGGQGNLWTEFVGSPSHAEYMIFPREIALAEATWSSKKSRNYDDFLRRLQTEYLRLDELGINYRRTDPEQKPTP